MSSNKAPIFLLVPGAWHKPPTFSKLRRFLSDNEYESLSVALPSTGGVPATKTTEEDVEVIKNIIEDTVSTGRDIILVCHSYGGIPTSEACKYFTDAKEGRGRIRGMLFLCAFAFPPGTNLAVNDAELSPGTRIEGDYVVVDDPVSGFYNDLSENEAVEAVKALESFSLRRESTPTTFSPCGMFPSWYILAERDNMIPPAMAEAMINGMKQLYPGSFNVVERMDTGHSPFLSQPENLGKILIRAAKEL
ncbi:hypothetical protein BP6252_08917 [Coleophoma cylindrospora]|uniref:AB hydrolase-1 domain-containing protein n=1 Tax=Coleophoma cylindrospora TaxID=1849047 RepID=A0A3D8R0T4_9HELO|nr:hypothetical protein BP6252_08917 [Coleophoma cylindrospora]